LFILALPVVTSSGDAVKKDGSSQDPKLGPESPGTHLLTVWFIDASTMRPTTVRAGVFDVENQPIVPRPRRDYLFQRIEKLSYFYGEHTVRLEVQPGPVTIRAMKGFEYDPAQLKLSVQADTTVVIYMNRWTDLREAGWFSGETHTHMTHGPVVYELTPQDMIRVMEGEDLHFLNSMDLEEHFNGGPHPSSSAQRVLYFSREYRNLHFGHISLVGLSEWVSTVEACWDTVAVVACGKILNSVVAGEVHSQPGAILIATHPFPTLDYFNISAWPGGGVARGIPIDLVDGSIDAIDILSYSHQPPPVGLEEHMHALNAGFRIPASAGTDATLAQATSFPPGGYRVYARVGDGPEDFGSQAWIDAVRAGRSFVTNAPVVTSFSVDGQEMGDVVSTHETVLSGEVSARCAVPLRELEIVTEWGVVASFVPPPGSDGRHIQGSFTIRADWVRWVVARVNGVRPSWYVIDASGLFAQTNPIYIDFLDHPEDFVHLKQREAEGHFVYRLSQLTQLYDMHGYFPGVSRAAFDDAVARASAYYHGLTPDPPEAFALLSPKTWSYLHQCYAANTTTPSLVWEPAVDNDPYSTVLYELTYGPDSTFVIGAQTVALSDTIYSVPSESALTDLERYYWKVDAVDDTGLRTTGTPSLMRFIVDISATGTAGPAIPSVWSLGPAVPNPFNPDTRVEYTVPPGAGAHSVEVVDVRGALVKTLFAGTRSAGRYTLHWDATNDSGNGVASGVYFLCLASERAGLIYSRKIVALK
jgi:hypothetical protein